MASNPEFNDTGHDRGNVDPELYAQAERISSITTHLLDNGPTDWDQTKLFYQTPLGADFRLELTARAFRRKAGTLHNRDITILHKDSQGSLMISPLMLDLNYEDTQPIKMRLYEPDMVAELLDIEGIDDDVKRLILDATGLKSESPDNELVERVNGGMAALLDKGMVHFGHGVRRHMTIPGDKVSFMTNSKDGDEPWPAVDKIPEIQVRVEFDGRAVDIVKEKGSEVYESLEVDPSTGHQLRVVANDNVVEIGGAVVIFDDGSMEANESVLKEAERAMGLRALNSQYLDRIESALKQVAAERL
jgi:hypothetical protein